MKMYLNVRLLSQETISSGIEEFSESELDNAMTILDRVMKDPNGILTNLCGRPNIIIPVRSVAYIEFKEAPI